MLAHLSKITAERPYSVSSNFRDQQFYWDIIQLLSACHMKDIPIWSYISLASHIYFEWFACCCSFAESGKFEYCM